MAQKLEVGLPDKMALFNRGTHIEIVRTWFGGQVVLTTAFAIFWDGFLVFWYSSAAAHGDMMALLFPLLHVGAGVWITYYSIAGWLNKTWVTVGGGKVTVRHGPVPWPGNRELSTGALRQLYAKEARGRNTVAYEVHAVTDDGRDVKLVGGLESSEQALYVEQEIEKTAGIKDEPVKGELGGP